MTNFTCGYREVQGMASENSAFQLAGPNLDSWRPDGTCSYCGSTDPDKLLKDIYDRKVKIEPTDKSYKIYVQDIGTDKREKFYFYHFTTEQKQKFVELINTKAVNFLHPGYFYVMPYFIKREG